MQPMDRGTAPMADFRASSSSLPLTTKDNQRRLGHTTGKAPRLHHLPGDVETAGAADLAALAKELAVQSRREQGLPDQITDAAALAQGAQLVLALRQRTTGPRTRLPP
jgi:hypothetical protein